MPPPIVVPAHGGVGPSGVYILVPADGADYLLPRPAHHTPPSPFAMHPGSIGSLFQVASTFGILLGNIAGYFILGPARDAAYPVYCKAFTADDIASMTLALVAPGLLLGMCACFVTEGRHSRPSISPPHLSKIPPDDMFPGERTELHDEGVQ